MNIYSGLATSSFSVSGSLIAPNITGSLEGTASWARNALTASYANNLTVAGTLTAQTLVVQTITSSVLYSSGSNIFGNNISNTQVFTGSLQVTGSTHYLLGNVGIGTTGPIVVSAGYSYLALNNSVNGGVIEFQSNGTRIATINNNASQFDIETKISGPITFGTNNSERLRIAADGNVGIGTTSPAEKVSIVGNLKVITTTAVNNAGTASIILNPETNTSATIQALSNFGPTSATVYSAGFKFITANRDASLANPYYSIDAMSILANGNVGIGTTTPSFKLDVSGSSRFTSNMVITGSLLISGSSPLVQLGSTTFVGDFTNPAITFGSTSNGIYTDSSRVFFKAGGSFAGGFSSDGIIANQILIRSIAPNDLTTAMYTPYRLNAIGLLAGLGGNSAGDITLITSGSARLYVSSSGNVGIGTTTPVASLEISTAETSTLRLTRNNNTANYLELRGGSNGGIYNINTSGTQDHIFQTADSEKLRITSAGNVGIGTSSPSYSLDVNGTARVSGNVSIGVSSATTVTSTYNSTTRNRITYTNGSSFEFFEGANERMRLAPASGNLLVGTTTDIASSKVTIESTTQGFLQPRMTTTQRNAITSPATGLQVYNTTTNTNDTYNGTSWLSEGNVSGSGTSGQVAYWNGTNSQTGSNNLFWDAANNYLGVGTNNPLYTFHAISAATTIGAFRSSAAANGQLLVGNTVSDLVLRILASGDAQIHSDTGKYLSFGSNGATERARITSGGNILVGTTTDNGEKFQVNGTARVSDTSATILTLNSTNGTGYSAIKIDASGVEKGLIGFGTYLTSDGGVAIRTAASTPFTIAIGSGVPTLTLATTGAATFSSSVTATSLIKSGGTSSQYLMADGSTSTLTNPVTGTGTTNYLPKWTSGSALGNSLVYDDGTNVGIGSATPVSIGTGVTTLDIQGSAAGGIAFGPSGTKNYIYGSSILYIEANTTAVFTTGGSERMRLTSTGLGIGTTSPNTSLEANGIIRSDRVGVASQYVQINGGDAVGPFITAAGANKVLTIQNNSTTSSDIYFDQAVASTYQFKQASVTKMTLDASGNLGLGVVPSAWNSSSKALQVSGGSIYASTTYTFIGSNAVYTNTGDQYINTGFATVYGQINGEHRFYNAPSGTAGNPITFTQAMTLTSGGNLLVGTTTDSGEKLVVNGTTKITGATKISNTGGIPALDIRANDTNFALMSIFGNQTGDVNWLLMSGYPNAGNFTIRQSDVVNALTIAKTTGAATFSSSVTATNGNFINAASNFPLTIDNSTQGYVAQVFKSNGVAFGYVGNANTLNSGGSVTDMVIRSENALIFSSASTEKMRLTSVGRLLLGTTTESTYLLDVSGSGRFSGDLLVTSAGSTTITNSGTNPIIDIIRTNNATTPAAQINFKTSQGTVRWQIATNQAVGGGFEINEGNGTDNKFYIAPGGAATFSSTLRANGDITYYNSGNLNAIITSGASDKGRMYLYSGGNADIGFQAGGNSWFTNNLGIGTSSPNAKLTSWTSSTTGIQTALRLNNPFGFANANTGTKIVFSQDRSTSEDIPMGELGVGQEVPSTSLYGYMFFSTLNSTMGERMRITATGNVGIGTTSPSYKLDVNGTGLFQNNLFIKTTSDYGSLNILGYDNGGINIIDQRTAVSGEFYSSITFRDYYLTNSAAINFYHNQYFGAGVNRLGFSFLGSEKLSILYNGNVGIGTTNPLYKLHVSGSSAILKLDSTAATFGNPSINMLQGGVDTILTATNNGLEIGTYSAHPIYFKVNASNTAMTVLSGGNVGIGNTNPGSYSGDANTLVLGNTVNSLAGMTIATNNGGTGGVYFADDYNDTNAEYRGYLSYYHGTDDLTIGAGGSGRVNISSGSTDVFSGNFSVDTNTFFVNATNNRVGIGTAGPSYQLELSTDSAAKPSTNTWTISSDARLKENIIPYTKGLDALVQINPVTYDYNGKAGFNKIKNNIGIIAQDVLDILPESISTYMTKLNENDENDTELYNFNSHALTYILINAIKELKAEIDILKNK